jgi:hypothetical protein
VWSWFVYRYNLLAIISEFWVESSTCSYLPARCPFCKVLFNIGQADNLTLAKLAAISSFGAYRMRKFPAISGVINAVLKFRMIIPYPSGKVRVVNRMDTLFA